MKSTVLFKMGRFELSYNVWIRIKTMDKPPLFDLMSRGVWLGFFGKYIMLSWQDYFSDVKSYLAFGGKDGLVINKSYYDA